MADSALPPPADLEYKSTKDAVIGYTPAAVPHISRSGTELTDAEVEHSALVVGSPAQGNGLQNSQVRDVGLLTTESGGTQERPALGSTERAAAVRRNAREAKD